MVTIRSAPKLKRTVDPQYLSIVRTKLCFACGVEGPNEAHHIQTRGSGGGDDWWNVIPLCQDHHTMGPKAWHNIGAISFLDEFPHVEDILRQWGWRIEKDKIYRP